jgi:hypothetical protein
LIEGMNANAVTFRFLFIYHLSFVFGLVHEMAMIRSDGMYMST